MFAGALEVYYALVCQPFEQTAWSAYLIWLTAASVFVLVFLYGFGAVRRQVLAVALGLGMTADFALNFVLRQLFRGAPPIATCIPPRRDYVACVLDGTAPSTCLAALAPPSRYYAMPSYQVEHLAFFLVGVGMYPMAWYTPHVRTLYIGLAVALYAAVVVAQLYFNINSPLQALAGAAFGAAFGWLWTMGVIALVWPHVDALLASAAVRRFYPMVDTLGLSYEPVRGDPPPLERVYDDERPLDDYDSVSEASDEEFV